MRNRIISAVITCALFLILLNLYTVSDLPAQNFAKEQILGRVIAEVVQRGHYSPLDIDDKFSERVFDTYIQRLDFAKRFYLQSDIRKLQQFRDRIDDEIRTGQHELSVMAHSILDERKEEAQSYYKEILERPFDFSIKETLDVDGEKREYCATKAEIKERWRKILKYQTLNRYLASLENREKKAEDKDESESSEDDSNDDPEKQLSDEELEEKAREQVRKSLDGWFARINKEDQDDKVAQYFNAVSLAYGPHTGYFPPKEKENFDIGITGRLEGIGAQLSEKDGYIEVVNIVPGSASWRQKELKEGDLILKVAQGEEEPVDVVDVRLSDAVQLIRGPKGTEVRLTVKKPDGDIVVIPIIRDVVIIEETYAKSAVIDEEQSGKRFGYIYLPKFYTDFRNEGGRRSSVDIRKELDKLKTEKVDGIVLDLRNNGGGSLRDAVDMSGLFIEKGPIVQVNNRVGKPQVLADSDARVAYDGPLVVLVNSFSASASEILAAALQDYGRAVIIGSKSTFGKGTVQKFVDLNRYIPPELTSLQPFGSLKLTIQQFYRINGESTQFKGVESDIVLPDQYSMIDYGEKSLDYALPWKKIKSLEYQTWPANRGDVTALQRKSSERVAKNEFFQLIKQRAQRLHNEDQNTIQSLLLSDVQNERAQRKAENEKLKNFRVEHPHINVTATQADRDSEQNDPDWEEKRKDWHEQINKDAYINEAIAILADMIG